MDQDDRERAFEQALARRLRAQDASTSAAQTPAMEESPNACPDAEALAAFHERPLPAAEMAALQEHVAGCPRCREILELLQASDATPLRDEPATAPAAVTIISQARRPAKMLRWIAPTGAIAALLLIWITARQRSPRMDSAKSVELAQEQRLDDRKEAISRGRESDLSSHGASSPAPQTAERGKATESRADGLRKVPAEKPRSARQDAPAPPVLGGVVGGATIQGDAAGNEVASGRRLESKKTAESSNNFDFATGSADKEARDRTAANPREEVQNEILVAPQSTPPLKADRLQQPERDALAKQKTEPPAPRFQAGTGSTAPPASSQTTAAAKDEAKTRLNAAQNAPAAASAAPSPVPVQKLESTGSPPSSGSAQLKNPQYPLHTTVAAPRGVTQWRMQPGGLIERSTDAGKTWSPQSSGVTAELLAGSAPSESVCWLVGRGGTILRTIDGGAHWKKIVAPFPGDIRGIEAADALHATILAGDPPARFLTGDGGVGWAPVQETR